MSSVSVSVPLGTGPQTAHIDSIDVARWYAGLKRRRHDWWLGYL